jgi:hypothetical protein
MARTFEEVTREKAEELKEGLRSIGPGPPEGFDGSGLANIVRSVPDSLRPNVGDERRQAERTIARENFREALSRLLGGELDTDLRDLNSLIRELNNFDYSNATPIQEATLKANLAQSLALKGILEAQVTSATIQDSIASSVEPPAGITISGTNEIADADAPQTVVPQATDREIPVRKLYLRASPDNEADIYFGDDQVAPEAGFVLTPGEAEVFPLDFRESSLYMASSEEGPEIQLMGVF